MYFNSDVLDIVDNNSGLIDDDTMLTEDPAE